MRKQILLMCDDFSFCRRFQETMQDDTTTIQYFLTVADALDSYTRQRYCLVIMDSCLENVDSQKLLQMMPRAKPVPILVLTDGKPVEDEIKFFSLGVLLCKQAAKNFHTICKKETALKRVLSNLLSAVSLLRFKAVFSCGFRVPPGSGLYQSCAAGSVCIPAGQKYCSPRPRKSCPADRKTLGLPSRCIGHRW